MTTTDESRHEEVESFNERFPVGRRVGLRLDGGKLFETTIKYLASRLSTGMLVAWVNGKAGCWDARRIEMLPLDEQCTDCRHLVDVDEFEIEYSCEHGHDPYEMGKCPCSQWEED